MGKQNDPDFEKEVLTSTEARNLLLMSFTVTGWFMKIDGSQQGDDHNHTMFCLIKRTILVWRPKFWMP